MCRLVALLVCCLATAKTSHVLAKPAFQCNQRSVVTSVANTADRSSVRRVLVCDRNQPMLQTTTTRDGRAEPKRVVHPTTDQFQAVWQLLDNAQWKTAGRACGDGKTAMATDLLIKQGTLSRHYSCDGQTRTDLQAVVDAIAALDRP